LPVKIFITADIRKPVDKPALIHCGSKLKIPRSGSGLAKRNKLELSIPH